jgi:CheY-like chemotaxis protein
MSKVKILIVEDEQIIAKDLKLTLEGLGYSITATVTTGQDAIKSVEQDEPSIILMDIKLKGQMDGIQAAEKIKVDKNIPVIYITAFADEKIIERAKITEPFGYILKPFQEKELHSVIEMALYKHKSEKEKEALKEQIVKLTRKIPLTENERLMLYGLIRYPMFNDVELSKKLKIKRSTVTAIKNKLYKEGYYEKFRLPNFSLIGCELLTVIYGKFNKILPGYNELKMTLNEVFDTPEQICIMSTDKEFVGVCVSKNLTDIKKHLDSILYKMKEKNIADTINPVYLPFDISYYNFFDYSPYLKKRLDIKLTEEKVRPVKPKNRRLTNNEKAIFYALVCFPELNDSEIAQRTKLPRPSISQTKRRLLNEGFLKVLYIPDLVKINTELLAFDHAVFHDSKPGEFTTFINETGCNAFQAVSNSEACYINAYEDYTEYESKRKEEAKFFSENRIEVKSTDILSIPMLAYNNLQFAALLKKLFDLKVKF